MKFLIAYIIFIPAILIKNKKGPKEGGEGGRKFYGAHYAL
jgi:hypothetical protein